MSLISVSGLTFYYDGSYDTIFEDVSFQIDTNWKLGLTGRNGRGKTTLLKLLAGEYEYRGTIAADVEFDYFPYEVKDKGKSTIDIVEEIDPGYELWKIMRELSLLQVEAEVLYRVFSTLSNGEQTKVMLAVLFSREQHFLLIDEPTNHLDMDGRRIVMEYLNKKQGFILVSHDRYFLDGCVEYILSINKQDIQLVKGNFSTWWEEKERQDRYELAENERLQKDVRRLTEASQRNERWSDAVERTKKGTKTAGLRPDRGYIGHKAAKMMKRAVALENRSQEAIESKKKLLKNIEQADALKLYPQRHHKSCLVNLVDVTIQYDMSESGKPVLEHLNLTVNQGERVVLAGKNGCGKSSIIRLVLEKYKKDMVISYVSQDTSGLHGELREYAKEHDLDESLFMALLRKLDFSRLQFEKRLEEYSGGQKKKVLIAKSLCEKAHLYVWDEPLNYIDIFSRMQIMDLIKEYKPTMLLVEHDQYFVEDIATKVVQCDK